MKKIITVLKKNYNKPITFFIYKAIEYIKKNNLLYFILIFPIFIYCYIFLFFKSNKKSKNKKNVAIVLSWKRTINLPLVIYGLKKQKFIDDIIILHNHPSWLRIPGCTNVFYKENKGCIIRHQFANSLEGYEHFVFSDDDLVFKKDMSEEILKTLDKYGEDSVIGFFGRSLNLKNINHSYTYGKDIYTTNEVKEVDIVKGRFHIISKKGIEEINNSDLNTKFLLSEDDIRVNITLQRKFKKPSYLIPGADNFFLLNERNGLVKRSFHKEYRDRAILDAIKKGYVPRCKKVRIFFNK